jgi:hypothetical protein
MSKKLMIYPVLFLASLFIFMPGMTVIAQQFNGGIFGGVTASQVDGDSYGGFNKLGFTAGAFVNRELAYDISWQMEIKYVSRGAYENFGPDDPRIYKTVYRYVALPLSAHYLFNEKIQAELGISPEVLIHYASFDEYGKIPPGVDAEENRRIGLSAFAGVYYWFIPSTGVGLRYTRSAIAFREPQEWNNPQYRGYFHSVLSLTMAYRIRSR